MATSDKATAEQEVTSTPNGLSLPPVAAYAELAGVLRQKVLSGEIPEGERLPTELTLASEMGISRSTVREAFRVLQAWGYLRRVSPRIMVASKPVSEAAQKEARIALMEQGATHHDVYQTVFVLAPALAALAAERATDDDIATLRSIVAAQEKCLSDIKQSERLVARFQQLIAEISRNPAMALARASLRNLLMPTAEDPAEIARLTGWALEGHRRILDAIEAHDPELAALVTRRHIEKFRNLWEAAGLDFNSEISSFSYD